MCSSDLGPGDGRVSTALSDREAYDRIAPRYDVVSGLMTLGMGDRWRQAAAEAADVSAGQVVLDAYTGTGDLALMLADRVTRLGEVVGVDHSPEMIARARIKAAATHHRCRFEVADCTAMPFDDDAFDAATASGGIRSLDDPAPGISELVRVVRPGGRVVILEITPPDALRGAHAGLLRLATPALGGALGGDAEAFRHMAGTVERVPPPAEMAALMSAAGLRDIRWRRFAGGVATLHHGKVPA